MTTVVDGRKLRSERSRLAVVDAFLELVSEYNVRPTVEEVAARASVSQRSVFRHFPDVDSLTRAAVARRVELVQPLLDLDVGPYEALEDRIGAVVAQRAELHEESTSIRRVTEVLRAVNADIDGFLVAARRVLRDQITELFGPEMSRLDRRRRGELTDQLELVLSWHCWYGLRVEQRLSVGRSEAVVRRFVNLLLTESGRS